MARHAVQVARSTRFDGVEAKLVFAERGQAKPYAYVEAPPAGIPRSGGDYQALTVPIENARPFASELRLDVEGFAVLQRPTAVRDFWDEAQTLAVGHPEVAQLVKAATGAVRVVVFDHTRRRRIVGVEDRSPDAPRQPASRAHVDQTVASGPQRVRDVMGAQAEDLLRRRAAIINVWRPIAHVAQDWPLALADARTVDAADLIASDLIFPNRKGEIYAVAYNPHQRWLYVRDVRPDEVVLIKCWDSDPSVARFAPHTGFEDPTTPANAPPRESIEFRTIAFFD